MNWLNEVYYLMKMSLDYLLYIYLSLKYETTCFNVLSLVLRGVCVKLAVTWPAWLFMWIFLSLSRVILKGVAFQISNISLYKCFWLSLLYFKAEQIDSLSNPNGRFIFRLFLDLCSFVSIIGFFTSFNDCEFGVSVPFLIGREVSFD